MDMNYRPAFTSMKREKNTDLIIHIKHADIGKSQ